jgi:hypothetical protein
MPDNFATFLNYPLEFSTALSTALKTEHRTINIAAITVLKPNTVPIFEKFGSLRQTPYKTLYFQKLLCGDGFMDFIHCPKSKILKILKIKITTFRKLALLPSSGEWRGRNDGG